ncbi:helix-turn-helix domain-containing protein [Psychrobacillus vulpis]|uniref:Helix-turn-helix domain-containing protein n=1 Tax=Psychrobacillus vulpis TaxID=2325572 RepID=A0A544TVJ5_9BACI|nr:helix-turn-helix transcriptional regulator [Psychrobacillus vulpis]TQR21477.1 helix-turn-helix domain-containing protein [Psychrobacillus vulpis]
MPTLGERIRKLRKQQKMTLETLAGTELTKGMLSLIENNKANPSMESLNYIAEQLNVDVTELLEEVSSLELQEVLEKAELLFNKKNDDLADEYEQLIKLVEPYVPKLTQGYEAARLLEMYSKCLYHTNKNNWEPLINHAATMYEQMNLTAKRGDIGIFRSARRFIVHDYKGALSILLAERAELETNPLWTDPLSRLDYDYLEATMYFAIGEYDKAIIVMENAIEYSKKNKTFYRIDDLYRLAAAHAMMNENEEKKDNYLQKLNAYSEFADDKESRVFTYFANIHYLNSYKHLYEEADALFKTFIEKEQVSKLFSPFFKLEKGKILYGLGQFEEAIEKFEEVVIPEILHHPIDLSIFYEKDAYVALCYFELNQQEKAIEAAAKAVENINPMPHTPYKGFIQDTYEKVKI